MSEKPRVLLFPFLAHGHVSAFLQLARVLSRRNFRTYLCSTPVILDSVSESLKSEPEDFPIELVQLHLPESPQLPPRLHTTKNLPPNLIPVLMQALTMSIPQFSDIIATLQPDLVIYDGFQGWSAKIAISKGIPSLLFYTSSCTAYGFFQHLSTHKDFDTFPFPGIRFHEFEKRKMLDMLDRVPSSLKAGDEEEESDLLSSLSRIPSDIVLVNSCRSMEGKYMDHMSTLMRKRVVSVGPVVSESAKTSADAHFLEFMDQKPPSSIVYVSLGSENYLSKEQAEEMARGLELSTVNFIWVARSHPGNEDPIEDGFLERTKSRGMVVRNWAPQTAILAHPSVGAFISHCGWSSINESVYFGKPIIALPLKVDQPANSKLLVELGIGVEIRRDDSGNFDGEAVAEAISEVVLEKRGEGLRRRAAELSKKMKMDQEKAFGELQQEILRICTGKKGDKQDG